MVQFDISSPKERLIHLRRLFKLSQVQLSELLGVSSVTISIWENKEPRLTIQHYKKLIELGINPNFIITGDCITYYHNSVDDIIKNIDKKLTVKGVLKNG